MSVRVWIYDPEPDALSSVAPFEFSEVPRPGEYVWIERQEYRVRSLFWRGKVIPDSRHGDELEPYIRLEPAPVLCDYTEDGKSCGYLRNHEGEHETAAGQAEDSPR